MRNSWNPNPTTYIDYCFLSKNWKYTIPPLFQTPFSRRISFVQSWTTVVNLTPPSLCMLIFKQLPPQKRPHSVAQRRRYESWGHKYSTQPPCCANDVMSNVSLGDHAESLLPHYHSCLSKQTIPASCTNASFHIVSPLCKSKCGNRIWLIL